MLTKMGIRVYSYRLFCFINLSQYAFFSYGIGREKITSWMNQNRKSLIILGRFDKSIIQKLTTIPSGESFDLKMTPSTHYYRAYIRDNTEMEFTKCNTHTHTP